MRNPGYRRAEQAWSHKCDVLFNGIDFGPNLMYRSFDFTPAKPKKNETNVAGMPGRMDHSDRPGGYLVHDNMSATLQLWVRDAASWGLPGPPDGMSPEARFLAAVNGQVCRIDGYSFNGFYLMTSKCEITRYDRFKLGFLIVIKITAEPYWLEENRQFVEWSLNSVSRTNLFNPSTATLNTELLPAGQSCSWSDSPTGGAYELHADPGNYAEVRVSGLNPAKRYVYGCRNIHSQGSWLMYDGNGTRILSYPVTGISTIVFRLVSRSAAVLAVGFTDLCVYEAGEGAQDGEIVTLDAPLRSILCTASAPCSLLIGGELVKLPVGTDVPVYGLNVPPRTKVPVQIVADAACRGYISYQRGALSCTL